MNLAIIIPVFNSIFYTRQIIESIIKERENCKEVETIYVVVVDNASTDETLSFLESNEYWEKVENNLKFSYVHNNENLGYGGGINKGIEFVNSQKIFDPGEVKKKDCDFLILNNDMILIDGVIDQLIKTAYSTDNIGIVGGKLLFPDGTIQHGGAFLNLFGWGQHKGGGQKEEHYIGHDEVEEQEYVTGAMMLVKKEVFDKVGKFDERFEWGYFEECDLSYRAREYGYITVYEPKAKAIHFENITSKEIFGNQDNVKKQISDKNQILFYQKRDEEKKFPLQKYKIDNGQFIPEKENTCKLLLTSQIYSDWSFCHVMRNLAKGLKRNGVDVSIAPVEYHYDKKSMIDWEIKEMINKSNDYWNRVVLRSCEGDHMYLMPPGKQRIAHTTGESSRINQDWLLQLNNVDKVLTTSTFFRNVMLESGVKTPVFVLPNSVNLDLFKREGDKLPIDSLKGLNFVSIFHFGERKAPNILIKAFCKAFTNKDDVTLTIHSLSMKQNLVQQGIGVRNWISNLVGEKPDKPTILITSTYIEDALVPSLLRNFDVFVLPTRGEGFCLPAAEAAALGIPSIITNYSGVLDIVDEDSGWLIAYKLKDIPLQYLPYFQNYIGGKWAEPDIDHLVELFHKVYNNRDQIKKKGQRAYEKAQSFGINQIGKLAKDLIFEE